MEGPGVVAMLLTLMSYLVIAMTFPFSLCFCFKIAQVIPSSGSFISSFMATESADSLRGPYNWGSCPPKSQVPKGDLMIFRTGAQRAGSDGDLSNRYDYFPKFKMNVLRTCSLIDLHRLRRCYELRGVFPFP